MKKNEKPKLNLPKKIELGYSSLQGRGVFATEDIVQGEIVERAPLVVMGFRMNYHKDPAIWDYMFTNTCPCEDCKKHGGHFLMVMGYGQMYNHQDDNSAEIRFDLKNQIADIVAIKKIKKGDEIFVNYGPNYFKNKQKLAVETTNQSSTQITDQIPPIRLPTMMETPVVEAKDKQVYRPL
jgi:hypothetical protein